MNEPLPELQDATIDAATLWQLAADLEAHAEMLEVRRKGAPTGRAQLGPIGLRDALTALEAGQLRGVQIHYRFQGTEWRDTLLRTEGGFRIVRMAIPELP